MIAFGKRSFNWRIVLIFMLVQPLSAYSLVGIVSDSDTQEPIPNAIITIPDLNTHVTTDLKGVFRFNNTLPEKLALLVSAEGYKSVLFPVNKPVEDTLRITLQTSFRAFDELVISSPVSTLSSQTITNTESRNIEDLKLLTAGSIGDMISNIPGVYQNSNGAGISKPVIRGLSQNRVVTYLNGLRIENQQWGGDHGLGVTDLGIGRVEIIKGPASLLYGSDALGGVLYLIDEPYAAPNTYHVSASSRFETASLGTRNSVGLKFSKNKFRINAFGNFLNFADYQLPNGKYVTNSRYNALNGKVSIGYNHKNWVTNIRYNYVQNRFGIPGHTHDSLPTPDDFQSFEQNRSNNIPAQVNHNHYILWQNKFYLSKSSIEINLGQVLNRLQEFEEKFTIPALDMMLNTTTYNIFWKREFDNDLNWIVGAQGMYQTNTNADVEEQLIPDAQLFDNGIYTLINKKSEHWQYETGLRFDSRLIETEEFLVSNDDLTDRYESFNFSFGVARNFEKFYLKSNITSGFRAPHTSELLSNGVHHGSMRYEIGDSNLKSEKAFQIDLLARYETKQLSFQVNPFINLITDYIGIQPSDSTIENLPVFFYSQIDRALLYGGETNLEYRPQNAEWLKLGTGYSIVIGTEKSGRPLTLIPQSRISSFAEINLPSKRKVKLQSVVIQHQYFFSQNRVGVFEEPSSEYQLLNIGLKAKADFKTPLEIGIGVRNLLNSEYIDHLSGLKNIGVPASGRNFYITVKINLNSKTS